MSATYTPNADRFARYLAEGMREVTRQEFYDFMGPRDVSPSLSESGRYEEPSTGYLAVWKTPRGQVLGACIGVERCGTERYALAVPA